CCRKSGCLLQLFDQLPAVESIQKVDITRFTAQYLNRQFAAVLHEDAGWLPVWVASIFECQLICHEKSILSAMSGFLPLLVFIDNAGFCCSAFYVDKAGEQRNFVC